MQNPKFQLFPGQTKGQHFFRLFARNGESILQSEAYTSKAASQNGVSSVRVNSPLDRNYQKFGVAPNFYFTLRASNGETLGRSEMYTTSAARDNGIEACKSDAPGAPTEDLDL